MTQEEQYKAVISEIIAKQSLILGPEMAIMRAKRIEEIIISPEGKVVEVKGDSSEALKKLIDVYVELSGEIVRNALTPIFIKYPEVKSH